MVRQELTYNQIFDEGAHIACGMEWLSLGTYDYETLHPPLARAAIGLPLLLEGIRSQGHHPTAVEGTALLNTNGTYVKNLLLARLGVMPFFWLANLLLFLWMRQHFGPLSALLAVVLFSFCPPVLAHSALATTDAPFAAMYLFAMLAADYLLAEPSSVRGCLAGLAFALALLCKFTALPFFIVSSSILLFWYWRNGRSLRVLIVPALLGCVVVCLTILTTYHFSFQALLNTDDLYRNARLKLSTARPLERELFLKWRIPAVEFFRGVYGAFLAGSKQKRLGYALGHLYAGGRWYFFPLAVLSKTPIALLVLATIGLWTRLRSAVWRSRETVLIIAGFIGPMLIAIVGNINLGLRHVLPIYPFLAMFGALGIDQLLKKAVNPTTSQFATLQKVVASPRLILGGLLIAWEVVACLLATPQFIPYFNEAAKPFFGYVLVDSDLDWGQDLYHLEQRLHGIDPTRISYAYFGDDTILRHASGQWRILEPNRPTTGWIAISESTIRRQASDFAWLQGRTFERVGRSIRLYHVAG